LGSPLTPREPQVLELLVNGLDVPEIEERLQLYGCAVATHTTSIIEKLAVGSRAELVALVERNPACEPGNGPEEEGLRWSH
jgi:DNA-binding NarL/FixJ family response regulator